jgi:hypothetical protein
MMIDDIIQDPRSTTRMQQYRNQPFDLVYFQESVRDCADLESGIHREQGTYRNEPSRDGDGQIHSLISLDDMTTTRHSCNGALVAPFSPKDDALVDNPTAVCWKGNRARAYAHDFSSPTSVLADPCMVDLGACKHMLTSTTLRRLVTFFPSESTEELPWIPVVVIASTVDPPVMTQRGSDQNRRTNDAIMSRLEEGLSVVDKVHVEPEPTADDSTFCATMDQLILMWELVRNGNHCGSGTSCEIYPGSTKDHSDFVMHLSI